MSTPKRTALVNGREMSVREISEYVEQTRGYKIERRTLHKRIRAGLYGEALLSKPRTRCRECDKRIYCKGLCYRHYMEEHGARPDTSQYHVTTQGERLVTQVSVPGWGFKL